MPQSLIKVEAQRKAGHRILQRIPIGSVLPIREVKECFVNLLLNDRAVGIGDLDPDVIVLAVRRLGITLLVLLIQDVALEEEKEGTDCVAGKDDAPRNAVAVMSMQVRDRFDGEKEHNGPRFVLGKPHLRPYSVSNAVSNEHDSLTSIIKYWSEYVS